jgi:catechol 2,3-dioxygenase-like lactoylglutathione lyase family enzyme
MACLRDVAGLQAGDGSAQIVPVIGCKDRKRVTLKNIIGIDHTVVVVKDLDAAAANWKQLGFTVSPRGTHSAKMGTGNTTIMLGDDYIELLGVLAETELNTPSRAFLARTGGGIERIAFTTPDAAAGADEIRAHGYEPLGPTDFERPVTMPDGTQSAAKFRTFQWPVDEAPGGVRLFACEHKSRETVWIPHLQKHANSAQAIQRVIMLSPEPQADAKHLARMIDGKVESGPDGAFLVPSGSHRADFAFMTRDQLASQYPGVSLAGLPERGGAALVLVAGDLSAAEKAVGSSGVKSGAAIVVPPATANGVMLAFVAG